MRNHIISLTLDRRTPEQLAAYARIEQARADLLLEREWRRRVAENIRARAAERAAQYVERKRA